MSSWASLVWYYCAFVGSKFFLVFFWVQTFFSWIIRASNSFLVAISWIQNVLLWVFRGSKVFSRGYFVRLRVFLWAFSGSKIFTGEYFIRPRFFFDGYFVDPKLFLLSISWIQSFFSLRNIFCTCEMILSTFSAHPF